MSNDERALVERIDQAAMLAQVERWAAVNSGTRNLAGVGHMAALLADAFAVLPGEIAMVDGLPRSANVHAISDCTLTFVSRDAFGECLRKDPELYRNLTLTLAARLRQADAHLLAAVQVGRDHHARHPHGGGQQRNVDLGGLARAFAMEKRTGFSCARAGEKAKEFEEFSQKEGILARPTGLEPVFSP